MRSSRGYFFLLGGLLLHGCGAVAEAPVSLGRAERAHVVGRRLRNNLAFANPSGELTTYSTGGAIDLTNPFFQPLGTNGRSCATCHQPADAWSLTPAHIAADFDASGGTDPLFRTVDTSNSPAADVSTVEARRAAYSLFLARGVVRFTFPIPPGAEFSLLFADDPYGNTGGVTVFRRPLPATNVKFLSTVMWDGRAPRPDDPSTGGLPGALERQANDAHRGHAEATSDLTDAEATAIVNLQISDFTAQLVDNLAGNLTRGGARGGAKNLSTMAGGRGPFDLYSAWTTNDRKAGRAAIRRGQDLFNTRPINIAGVRGIDDQIGTCQTCHDAANVGGQSAFSLFDIGVSAASRRPADLPLYTFINSLTGESASSTDPGAALITGKWSDLGRFKSPSLRGLAGRAPYFHDGSAATIEDVVEFYEGRFQMGLSADEKADLAAFLRAL